MTVSTYTGRVINIQLNNDNNSTAIIVTFVDDTDGQTKTLVLNKFMFDVHAGEIEYLGPDIRRVMRIVNQYFAPADTTMTFTIHHQNHITLNLSCDAMDDGANARTGVEVVLSDYYDVPVFAFL